MKEFLIFLGLLILLVLGLAVIYFRLKAYVEKALGEPFYSVKERLQDLSEIRRELQRLYLAEELLKSLKEEVLRLSQIFISRGSGKAGERALEELLSIFPSHLLKRDLPLFGGVVEFALKLPEEKYLPIDSKFIAPELLKKESLTSFEERELLRRIRERAKEIAPYLRDERCCGLAIMTCPDGLFPYLQRRVFEDLEKERILLVPYSLLPSLLLFLHFFWERFGKEINQEALSESLSNLEKWTAELEKELEKLEKNLKTLNNLLFRLAELKDLVKRELTRIREPSHHSRSSKPISE